MHRGVIPPETTEITGYGGVAWFAALSGFPGDSLQEDFNAFPSQLGHFMLALHGGR